MPKLRMFAPVIPFTALVFTGCIDASKPCAEPQAASAAAAPAGGNATAAATGAAVAGAAVKTCSGAVVPAPDGLLDDFEDGNSQLTVAPGRDGYWWTHHDPNGSTLAPEKFVPDDGGAGGSKKALHVHGTTATEQGAYGSSIGVNLASKGLYDGSAYAGLSFKAKVGPSATRNVRVKIGDVNTHGQLGTCKSCWNHFGKDIQLGTEWQEYRVMFSEAQQAQGWGDPRPPSLTPSELASIDWTIGPGATFDLWIDDVQFVTCQ
jgi:hypothetical protein